MHRIDLIRWIFLISVGHVAFAGVGHDYAFMSGEKKLISKMLNDYKFKGKIGRPVRNVQDTVVVKYGLSLIQIMSLDEKNQILTVNVWAKHAWVDEMLKWNPKNYSNVKEVRMPPDKIWTPDIVLYNYADERLIEKRDVMLSVNNDGGVIWMPPAIFKSTCGIDISNFPFDYQSCYLKFGSWTYKGDKLDIQLYANFSEIDILDYTESNEWKILHKPARRFVMHNKKDNSSQPDITFFLVLKRNPAYHAYLLVVPCVLLSLLTLVIFWLPPESPAKMILGMNIFVAFSLLLRLLAETTPSASTSVPFLGYYYCLNMILITLSTFLSIIVINLYFRCDKRRNLPDWLRKSVNTTSKYLGMKQVISSASSEKLHLIKSEIKNSRNHIKRQQEKETTESRETIPTPISPRARQKGTKVAMEMQNLSGSSSNYPPRFSYPRQVTEVTMIPDTAQSEMPKNAFFPGYSHNQRFSNQPNVPKNPTQQKKTNQSAILLEENLSEIRKALKNLMIKIAEKDRCNRIAKEWRMVAMVLDRLFFWVYFVAIIMAGMILLMPRGLPKNLDMILNEYAKKYENKILV